MKDPLLYNELSEVRYKRLNDRCWKTLSILMKKCLLKNEYEILFHSFKKNDPYKSCASWTQKTKDKNTELMIKLLLRCEKMYDAKHDIVKILNKIMLWDYFVDQIENDCIPYESIEYEYKKFVKLGTRIYNSIETLRVDHPMLNRPFIFNGSSMQNKIVKVTLQMRKLLIKTKGRDLKNALKMVLDKNGRMVEYYSLKEEIWEKEFHEMTKRNSE